jgi:hypothetical protein
LKLLNLAQNVVDEFSLREVDERLRGVQVIRIAFVDEGQVAEVHSPAEE